MVKIKVTAGNFRREVLESECPVLAEFFSDLCPKCAMLDDMVDEIAGEYEGIVVVGRINIEEEKELAEKFEIEVTPTFILFRGGEAVAAAVGVVSKGTLKGMIEN